MHKPIFRVYVETEAGQVVHGRQDLKAGNEQVTLRAGDVLAWLADATDEDRSWLADFANDEITISIDLYEVIQAYRHFRRSA